MKIIKITLVLASIVFFTSIPFNANARDCSDPQGFHEKMMCKVQGSKTLGNSVESSSSDETKKNKKSKKVKKAKTKSKLQEFNEKYGSLADIVPGLSKD